MRLAELLAPVGKMETAIAAIENGADALFVGGKHFNARGAADNFTNEELEEIVNYAKLRGVKVYVTVNILIKESEIRMLLDYLYYLAKINVDAIIVQDLGIVRLVKQYLPNLRLHASTQLSAHSIKDVQFLKNLGFKRVVLAREMKLTEIKEIIDHCEIEIETFVHGALCYSYSGQCLMSSLIGGRSGNRGYCAQTCRMRYTLREDGKTLSKSSYLLSLKDICTLEYLPELLASGIHSFKIEGRMKSPEYVASVVRLYRKYIRLAQSQEDYKVSEEDLLTLKSIFNRGGFSTGYYFQDKKLQTPISPRHIGIKVGEVMQFSHKTGMATIHLTHPLNKGDGIEVIREGKESVGTGISKECLAGSMIKCHFDKNIEVGSSVYLTKNHLLLKQMRQTYAKPSRKLPIQMHIKGVIGQPIQIELSAEGQKVVYEGERLEKAQMAPITKEKALEQLTKLGSTPFEANKVIIEWQEDLYLSIRALNQARREAILKLEACLLKKEDKIINPLPYQPQDIKEDQTVAYAVYVTSLSQLKVVLMYSRIQIIYWEWNDHNEQALEALALCQKVNKLFYLALPPITKEKEYKRYEAEWMKWKDTTLTGFLVRTIGQFNVLAPLHKERIIDFNLNVMNHETLLLWKEQGATRITLSVEMDLEDRKFLKGPVEQMIYGHIPVMTSAQCVLKGTPSCKKKKSKESKIELEDRKQVIWSIKTDCKSCIMQVMSYKPIVLYPKSYIPYGVRRIQFTNETEEEIKTILETYLSEHFNKIGSQPLKGITFTTVL